MIDSSKKIFIRALKSSVTDKDLIEFFSKYWKIKNTSILFDNNRNVSCCFGFITFEGKGMLIN